MDTPASFAPFAIVAVAWILFVIIFVGVGIWIITKIARVILRGGQFTGNHPSRSSDDPLSFDPTGQFGAEVMGAAVVINEGLAHTPAHGHHHHHSDFGQPRHDHSQHHPHDSGHHHHDAGNHGGGFDTGASTPTVGADTSSFDSSQNQSY
jgi:hypothetical protein